MVKYIVLHSLFVYSFINIEENFIVILYTYVCSLNTSAPLSSHYILREKYVAYLQHMVYTESNVDLCSFVHRASFLRNSVERESFAM